MKRSRVTVIALVLMITISAVLVQAQGGSWFLSNGYQALFYHAIRIEDSFPGMNPVSIAIAEFEKAVRDGSGGAEANLMMGMIYQYMNRPGTALGYYVEFVKDQPEEIWVYSLIGDLYAEMGHLDDAQRNYEKALVLQDADADVFAQAYLGIGNTALERKDYEKAREAFELALESAGDYFEARLALGKTLYFLEDYEEAITILERGKVPGSLSIPFQQYLGLSYEAAGRTDQAKHAFERVEELKAKK